MQATCLLNSLTEILFKLGWVLSPAVSIISVVTCYFFSGLEPPFVISARMYKATIPTKISSPTHVFQHLASQIDTQHELRPKRKAFEISFILIPPHSYYATYTTWIQEGLNLRLSTISKAFLWMLILCRKKVSLVEASLKDINLIFKKILNMVIFDVYVEYFIVWGERT